MTEIRAADRVVGKMPSNRQGAAVPVLATASAIAASGRQVAPIELMRELVTPTKNGDKRAK
jgi:hypothetical protein